MTNGKYDLRVHPAGDSEHSDRCMCTLQPPRLADSTKNAGRYTYSDSRNRDLDTLPALSTGWTQAFHSLTRIDDNSEPSHQAREILSLAARDGIEAVIATARKLGLRAPRRTNHYLRKAQAAAHQARVDKIIGRGDNTGWIQPTLPFGESHDAPQAEANDAQTTAPAAAPANSIDAATLNALGIHLPRQRGDQAELLAAVAATFGLTGGAT